MGIRKISICQFDVFLIRFYCSHFIYSTKHCFCDFQTVSVKKAMISSISVGTSIHYIYTFPIVECPEWYYCVIKAFSSIRKENNLWQFQTDNHIESCDFKVFDFTMDNILVIQFLLRSQFKDKSVWQYRNKTFF